MTVKIVITNDDEPPLSQVEVTIFDRSRHSGEWMRNITDSVSLQHGDSMTVTLGEERRVILEEIGTSQEPWVPVESRQYDNPLVQRKLRARGHG